MQRQNSTIPSSQGNRAAFCRARFGVNEEQLARRSKTFGLPLETLKCFWSKRGCGGAKNKKRGKLYTPSKRRVLGLVSELFTQPSLSFRDKLVLVLDGVMGTRDSKAYVN